MVYICVKNVPSRAKIQLIVRQLAPVINGEFEAINFGTKLPGNLKECYVRLSERLDARKVVDSINRSTRFRASIIRQLPSHIKPTKKGKLDLKTRIAVNLPSEQSPDKVFIQTHLEIMTELQAKYTGLFNLSKKTGHKLLDGIARKLFERLKQVSESNPECLDTGFKLSKAYRRLHPHFGDFTLILSTLHDLQDEAGAPRAHLTENDLISIPIQPYVIDNVPLEKVQKVCTKYSDKISKKITEYIRSLKEEEGVSEEEVAKKRVRAELKNMLPYFPSIIKEVISNHFIPRKAPFHKVRIYGEPFMPTKDVMAPFCKRHRAVSIMRSDRMYNMLRFNIPLQQYTSLMALDGTVVGGAKLVVRSSDMPTYPLSKSLIKEMRAVFGVNHGDDDFELTEEAHPEENMDDDDGEM